MVLVARPQFRHILLQRIASSQIYIENQLQPFIMLIKEGPIMLERLRLQITPERFKIVNNDSVTSP